MACHLAENDKAYYEGFRYSFSLDFLAPLLYLIFQFIESNYCSTLFDKFRILFLKGTLLFSYFLLLLFFHGP